MKIVVIGGSAFSTPELIRFLDSNKGSGRMDVVLTSRSLRRLEAVKRASMLTGPGDIQIELEVIRQDTWRRILKGADCVLIQIRVGGYEAGASTRVSPINMACVGMRDLALEVCRPDGGPGQ